MIEQFTRDVAAQITVLAIALAGLDFIVLVVAARQFKDGWAILPARGARMFAVFVSLLAIVLLLGIFSVSVWFAWAFGPDHNIVLTTTIGAYVGSLTLLVLAVAVNHVNRLQRIFGLDRHAAEADSSVTLPKSLMSHTLAVISLSFGMLFTTFAIADSFDSALGLIPVKEAQSDLEFAILSLRIAVGAYGNGIGWLAFGYAFGLFEQVAKSKGQSAFACQC